MDRLQWEANTCGLSAINLRCRDMKITRAVLAEICFNLIESCVDRGKDGYFSHSNPRFDFALYGKGDPPPYDPAETEAPALPPRPGDRPTDRPALPPRPGDNPNERPPLPPRPACSR